MYDARGEDMSGERLFTPQHDYLVCIDSDGCVFDTMEIKHKECFCPAYIEYFGLQAVSKYARDAWEFANLYSAWRGVHRLPVMLKSLDLLEKRKEVIERGFTPPRMQALRDYIAEGRPLNNAGLEAYLAEHPEAEEIRTTLDWSNETNARINRMVHGVPPFPHVRQSLERLSAVADIVIVSATQQLSLEREWSENGLLHLVSMVCGQESGSKKEIIARLMGEYSPDRVLMIGDAPGDRRAAEASGVLFYPICPDREAQSWAAFGACFDALLAGSYRQELQPELIAHFETLLPTKPGWQEIED